MGSTELTWSTRLSTTAVVVFLALKHAFSARRYCKARRMPSQRQCSAAVTSDLYKPPATTHTQTRMPIVMAALPNIGGGGALCSTPQSFADAHYQSAVQ